MNKEVFNNICKIIERDSKTSTYKFALLRGVIDIIQDNSPYIYYTKDRAHIPLGLLIEKWLLYYYPIFESDPPIPQINGNTNLAFDSQLKNLINEYKRNNGFSAFYNDLVNKGIPLILQDDFLLLAKKMQFTITDKPMRHIGYSISREHYSIFKPAKSGRMLPTAKVDLEYLIKHCGTFSIPIEYYNAFEMLGSFIGGQDSILFKWTEFSVKASGNSLPPEIALKKVLEGPITQRDAENSKKEYKRLLIDEGEITCVWSARKIKIFNVDHVIPFSIWKNNDLWNLLPSDPKTNSKKLDKIPSPELIEKRKDQILHYWELIYQNDQHSNRFSKEIQIALLGNYPFSMWREKGIEQLQKTCEFLITKRGYEEWKI